MKPLRLKTTLVLTLLTIYLYGLCADCFAAEPNVVSVQKKSSGGYCGIYCLYASMKYFGVKSDPNELLKPEYIGSIQGSSLAELKKAAEKFGLYSIAVDRITTKDLRRLNLPLIIHTKSSPTRKKYDHYELFLGSRQGNALVYDPPGQIESVEFWTLAPRWDGSALLISDEPISVNSVFASSRLRFVEFAGIAAAVVLSVRLIRGKVLVFRKSISRRQGLLLSLAQCVILVLAAASIAFAYNFINDEGMLLRKQAAENIQKAYQSSFVSKEGDKKSQSAGGIK